MSTISISGAGSGLDVASIVSSLMSAEKQALVPLTKEASSFNSLLSAYGSLKSSFSTFQTALNNLNDTNFSAQKTTLTNSGTGTTTEPFTASVDSSKAGKAVSQKLQSEVIANGTTFASGDSIAIQVGTEAPKFITLSEDQNLEQLVKTINDAKTDVNAAIFKDDDGKQHLVLESNLTGSSNTIKVFANGSLSTFGYNTSNTSPTTMTETRTAKDTAAAAPGVHDISISQLAQAQKLKTEGFDADTKFDSGILAIKTGSGTTTLINPKNSSLAGVRDAINASGAGVTASIVSDGSKSHLVLTAKETGAANTIKITGTESFAGFNFDSSSVATPQSGTVNETQTFDPTNSTLKLKVGNATSNITLTGSNLSLSDISDQINAANVGVTASVSTEGGLSKLVFTPDNAGMNVSLTATGTLSALNNTASATGITQMTAAQDAKVVIDGVLVTSKTNEVTDAISGVTLTLNKTTTPDDEFKLDISNDKSTVQSNVSTFVNAYNSLMKSLTSMTAYNAETKVAGSLQGDSGARSMMEQLRATMIQAVTGNGNLSTLSSIGVSMQKDGTYAVDAVKLNSAATDSFEGLSKLLTADKGIISNLKTLVTDFLGDDGIITQRTASIQKSIDLNAKRQEEMYTRFTQKEARYTKQFNNLDFTLTNLQSLQSQLTSQLASLSSSSK